jgi:hypothetical protein
VGNLRLSIACLRLVNLVFTAAAVWIAIGTVSRLTRSSACALVIGLLIATQPLYLITGVRVANDALGVLLATVAITGCLRLDGRRLLRQSATIGIAAGLAVLAKAVHFGLLPFVAFCWLAVVAREKLVPARAALAGFVMAVSFLLVTQVELRANLERYGALTSTQEVIKNRQDGRTTGELWGAAREAGLGKRVASLWSRDSLFVGGWSFLLPSRRLLRHHAEAVLLGLAGWLWLLAPKARPAWPVFRSGAPAIACVVLCLSYTAALAYHVVQSQLAWGRPTTNPWYASAALPWFILLVAAGGMSWPLGRLRAFVPAALLATFVAAEVTVTWGLMIATYSGGASGAQALRRLAALQPAILGTPTLVAASAGALFLLAAAIVACGKAWLMPPRVEVELVRTAVRRPHVLGRLQPRAAQTQVTTTDAE